MVIHVFTLFKNKLIYVFIQKKMTDFSETLPEKDNHTGTQNMKKWGRG